MSDTVLYDYWRSSASYRLRIALNMVAEIFRTVPVDIIAKEHRAEKHLARNPQGLVPVLEIDGHTFTQSLAVIEYLDETRGGAFLPGDSVGRQRVRALSYVIAMDIHPVCNSHVGAHVMSITGGGEEARVAWMRKFIGEGLAAFEVLLDSPSTGAFCHGDRPSMADICLVPQVYNARRWGVDLSACPRLVAIADRCVELKPFAKAHPDQAKPSGN
ncbi:maleylacetoacetate isomerase [Neorhizobium sp. BETTINA12A]|uniref:maleylacetoacetate isomerase n=1 Tax=Neorhizobium sp. BETTINA12A TaxID=2908924 RepID=UPI001FF6B475|nr:maleylacetoacetate isomerase [Neorhizobium sp. BETTINA12A]MCJ9751588.1 maleylacetoacetate isomerase [Neorhizobium sp. BETTINA12A]